MKKLTSFILLLVTTVLPLCAQNDQSVTEYDVTKYFLNNYGFDADFDYPASSSATVSEEIKDIPGWTPELSAAYTVTGIYEFGFQGTYNKAVVPATGYDGEAGGGLALSTGWEQTFVYYQTVTLPAGTYTISAPTYNGKTVKAGTSLFGWVPNKGTSVMSTVKSYPAKSWTLDQISFTLTASTTGRIQVGYKAAAGGSNNSANLLIDYVRIMASDMVVDKTQLTAVLQSANTYYGNGEGTGAADLKAAIDAAQAVADNADADMVAVLEATAALQDAIAAYRLQNVSEDNPLDCTAYILNPSFEQNGTSKWTVSDLTPQTNSSFKKKSGSTYLEKWVGQGTQVGDASIRQLITLPNGKYRLIVAAQNYNQASTTQKCKGAYIFAGDQQTDVNLPNDYSVTFTSISGEVEIGFVAQGATGNWLAVDNFRLQMIGMVDNNAVLAELQRLITEGEALLAKMLSATARQALQTAVDAAKQVDANSTETTVQRASKALAEALATAQESSQEYDALQAAIDEAAKTYDASKNGADAYQAAIDAARALVADADATSSQLAEAIQSLTSARLVFLVANGTGTKPKVTTKTDFYIPAAHGALIRATITGSNILERGVCWSTEPEPTIGDHRSTDYHNLKGMLFQISDMQPASVYYARAYAISKTYAVGYGDVVKVVTLPLGTCRGTWNEGAPDAAANDRCRKAIQQTVDYLNEWMAVKGFTLSGSYGSGTPTADCSYGGSMRIGPNAAYQAIGTVLHETGHGVGVGTHWRWYNCADTREHTTHGKWLGSWANKTLRFLENTDSEYIYWTGDGTHGWGTSANTSVATISYDWCVNGADKDMHVPIQYIGGCAILYALYIDGLCPTSAYPNGMAGYTCQFDDTKKYYIKCEDADHGLNDGFLFQRTSTAPGWTKPTIDQMDDAFAWYLEFVPSTGLYRFRNAQSGRYLSHSTSISMKSTQKPGNSEGFQLMPGRNLVTVGKGKKSFSAQSYWFTWDNSGSKSLTLGAYNASTDYGTASVTNFDFSNKATAQRFIIISEDDLETFQSIANPTAIQTLPMTASEQDGSRTITAIYSADGRRLQQTAPGVNIIRYSDGTTRKVLMK